MATTVRVVESGGRPVTESTNGYGFPMTPSEDFGMPVTIVASGGMPVIFISDDFVLLPGGGGGPDVTAPTITSANTASVSEGSTLSHALIADEAVTWTITGGADAAEFELSGSMPAFSATLRWAGNGTKDFESPDDDGANNTYVVQVTATDAADNEDDQTITITVTDAAEDSTPAAFSFVDQTNATRSTVYESNEITVTGIDLPANLTITGGEYSKNGGAYASAATTVVVNDTVKVRGTSSGSYSTAVNVVLTIGGVSDTYTITTEAEEVGGGTAGEPIGPWLWLLKAA